MTIIKKEKIMEKKLDSELIKKSLKERKINQTKFAEYLGVSRSAVTHYLSGRVNPTGDKIQKISEMLGIPESELYIKTEIKENDISMALAEYTARVLNELNYNLDKLECNINIKQKVNDVILRLWATIAPDLEKGKHINTFCPEDPVDEIPTKYIVRTHRLDGSIETREFKNKSEYNAYFEDLNAKGIKTKLSNPRELQELKAKGLICADDDQLKHEREIFDKQNNK